MPPNTVDVLPIETGGDVLRNSKPIDSELPQRYEEKYGLMVIQSVLNLLAHLLIGMTVIICFLFAFRGGLPLGATPLHIVLCVGGYNLLMAEAILCLTEHNGWTSKFRFVDKRRAHWILQIVGSVLAIAGSLYKSLDKNVNWNTLHGQFALVALVFTTVSLVNGCSSLWAYELRRFLPSNLSKITHICFGVVAYAAACIALCYGMDKNFFRLWISSELTDTAISFVVISTFIIIFNPLITFFNRTNSAIKKLKC